MTRDPRYDILFEPVQIGPVVARNRFYQVPHCCGMGHARPQTAAAMRGMKAEGGWAVVSTEECDIHHSSDVSPYIEHRLWDDDDIAQHALMVEAVHAHGALAAIELAHSGRVAPNHFTRTIPIGASGGPNPGYDPVSARAMTRRDIRELRGSYRKAALRSKAAGFDIVYVYAAHMLTLPAQFLSKRYNQRTDEYGGSLENRIRFLKELIIDAKEAVGDTCAIAVRWMMDEMMGPDGIECDDEGIEVVRMLAELPDLWDVNVSDWDNDSATSRFQPEGFQERYIQQVKQATTKPVVGVGRFTSPDTMVSQIKRGVLDMIGAARPSIADPFLPQKIEQGRLEDIRECIGCNICVSGDYTMTPIRCTQNPTMGEEWRRGWHPEKIAPATVSDSVLIIGAGPAGLECAVASGKRGHTVTIVDAKEQFGGRVSLESALPGLSAWSRVRDYRMQQLHQLVNVNTYLASELDVDDIVEFGADRVVIATGAQWRTDGFGRERHLAVPGCEQQWVVSPDHVMAGLQLQGQVVIYDDDHFYMGAVIAELAATRGADVVLVTPAADISHWTHHTLEQRATQERLAKLGVGMRVQWQIDRIGDHVAEFSCAYSDRTLALDCDQLVMVTARAPNDDLYQACMQHLTELQEAGISSIDQIGDCMAPGTIAAAVYSGHQWARQLGEPVAEDLPFAREMIHIES